MAALLAILAAVGWGSSDFLAGNASRRSSAVSVVIVTHFASVIALLMVAVDFAPLWSALAQLASGGDPEWSAPRVVGSPTVTDVIWGLAAGLGGGLGAMLLFRGLGKGSMAVVAPITAAGAATIPVLVGLASGDPLGLLSIAGIALALVAIVLVSLVAPESDDVTDDLAAADPSGIDPADSVGDESLVVPQGWIDEFRQQGDGSFGTGGAPLPAPTPASPTAPLPPPPMPVGTVLAPAAPVAPAIATAPDATPVEQPAAAQVASVDDEPDGPLAHLVPNLLRVVIVLLLALVAAASWIVASSIIEARDAITPELVGSLAIAAILLSVATGTVWASLPLLRTASTTTARPVRTASSGRQRFLSQPGLVEALLSGVGFGTFFVFIYRAGESAGQWPLIGARSVSVVMFVIAAIATSTAILPAAGSRLAVIWAGLFDAVAAILFVVATRTGSLSMAAVLASLYPAVTVLFAWGVTKERIRPVQVLGLALALGAVGLLAL